LRILIDTNVFIYREDDHVVSDSLLKLLAIVNDSGIPLLVHPSSKEDLSNDINSKRKTIMLSKIGAYPVLESPPNYENDMDYCHLIEGTNDKNSRIDNSILYSLYKDAVDFLITEDREIHKKALRLHIEDRVLLIDDALNFLDRTQDKIVTPPALILIPVYNLNLKDPIFDSLKSSYIEFEDWFKKISREGRKAWVYFREDGSIGALLIFKIEDEAIVGTPSLPRKIRLKISSFKVTHVGYKIGELFIRIACDMCVRNQIDEIYFTYFPNTDNRLIDLVSAYGFINKSINRRGEEVYVKETIPPFSIRTKLTPLELSTNYFPSFCDSPTVNKYIIPIRPEYHYRLFTDSEERQLSEIESKGFLTEGNTIRKAYVCHAKIRKMKPGDIILFYLSGKKTVTTLGIVESVDYNLSSGAEILRKVGKRTVYSAQELEIKAQKPTVVIIFRYHFRLKNKVPFNSLKTDNILKGPPQSITQITQNGYDKLAKMDGIDGRYIIH